jgi:hypothetical protein
MLVIEKLQGSCESVAISVDSGGRVCLDSWKQFLSDKLPCLMPLPAFVVVYSSKHHPVFAGQGSDADAGSCRIQSIP